MHDPSGLFALRGPTCVEDKCLLHTNKYPCHGPVNLLILPRGLPITTLCGTVHPQPRPILTVLLVKEVPFLFSYLCFAYTM